MKHNLGKSIASKMRRKMTPSNNTPKHIHHMKVSFSNTALSNGNQHNHHHDRPNHQPNNPPLHTKLPPPNRAKSTIPESHPTNEIYDQALLEAQLFDTTHNFTHQPYTVPPSVRTLLPPVQHTPVPSPPPAGEEAHLHYTLEQSHREAIRYQVPLTPYAKTGIVPPAPSYITLQGEEGIRSLRASGRLARRALDEACRLACSPLPGGEEGGGRRFRTAADVDARLHRYILENGAYPSPLNYAEFPRSICSSVNEVICHGIPDGRRLRVGDVASFDVSCYLDGYHGDNCATVLVGDYNDDCEDDIPIEQRPPRTKFTSDTEQHLFLSARRLIQASRAALHYAISTCHPGSPLSAIGDAVSSVADAYGYSSVEKYRGHGIGRVFHTPPFVKHYRTTPWGSGSDDGGGGFLTEEDGVELTPGMVFTIEPMLTEGVRGGECREWESDGWTVVTVDGGRASQFEHMVAVGEDGVEILTLPE